MSQLFSTELLPASDRIDAWQWNAQQICGDCRIQLPKSSFHGAIEIRSVGGLRLTRFSTTPLSFWKCPTDTVTSENRACIVITQIAGVRRYLQNGASVLLNPGDSQLVPSGISMVCSCNPELASPLQIRSYQEYLRTLFMLPGRQPPTIKRSAARVIAT